ncbi:MAG TPA: class I SAM-dependent methyltransferase [Jatrophihabitans sp.]|jgi:ubiquinone/menaquinone biosynthesis C-methylase UbiE
MRWYTEHVLPRLVDVTLGTAQHRRLRERVAAELHGTVLEIGFGSGLNLPHLPPTVTEVLAVEPSHRAVELAAGRISASTAQVRLVGLDGQHLDLPDDSVDCALSTWTLCTIPDAVGALREVKRVLRPGGTLRFVEHGRAPSERVRRWQNRLDPLQQRLAGGCHLNRDIPALMTEAGLQVRDLDTFYAAAEPKPFGHLFLGSALS